MKVKLSPLKIAEFFIIKSSLEFIQPKEENIDVENLLAELEIDLDFARTTYNKYYQVFVKVSINKSDKPTPGYQIFAEGVVAFDLEEEGLTTEEKDNYLNFTSLVIAINYLRNHISVITQSAPMGKYLLPSIDLKNLIEQKAINIKKAKDAEKAKKKK